jgi:hypothetical protein
VVVKPHSIENGNMKMGLRTDGEKSSMKAYIRPIPYVDYEDLWRLLLQ